MKRTLEICIDSVASARAAALGRADRVELCDNLPDGGTTPSLGMMEAVRTAFSGKMMVIIRPRGGDFLFDADEVRAMLRDIQVARESGADGVVIGVLKADGTVDTETCKRLIEAAGTLDITFHRAFDMTRDLREALETLVGLDIRRVLTSGGAPDVPSGMKTISHLVQQAGGHISIMPGGGITPENIGEVVRSTGVYEAHLSARSTRNSGMIFRNETCYMGAFTQGREYEIKTADPEKIRLARQALDSIPD